MAITTNKKIEIVEETKEIIKPVKTTKKETNTEKKLIQDLTTDILINKRI